VKHSYSAVFLCVAAVALFSGSTVRADSIPTFTATSASFSIQSSILSWSISGDSFSLGGGSGHPGNPGYASPIPGQPDGVNFSFQEIFGATAFTTGQITLNGVLHNVVLNGDVGVRSDAIYAPTVTGPVVSPNYPGTVGVTATLPTAAVGGGQLQELFCPNPLGGPLCTGDVLANLDVDIPGTLTVGGIRFPDSTRDDIETALFTPTPEPASVALEALGVAGLLGLCALGRKRWSLRNRTLKVSTSQSQSGEGQFNEERTSWTMYWGRSSFAASWMILGSAAAGVTIPT